MATVTEEQVEAAAIELIDALKDRPVILQAISDGYQMGTHPDLARWVGQVSTETKPPKLTQPSLETLAVIAYRQPISRAEIEAVRGVAVGGVLETLVERAIIRVAGRAEVPGRPLIYETTELFMQHFGLRDLSELPNVEELRRVKLPEAPVPTPETQPELIHESATAPVEN